jgi:thymidylate synthase (FAD)
MNFLNLRADSHAQYEIRQYAIAIYTLVAKVMPETMKAFVKYAYTGDILNGGVAHGQKEA